MLEIILALFSRSRIARILAFLGCSWILMFLPLGGWFTIILSLIPAAVGYKVPAESVFGVFACVIWPFGAVLLVPLSIGLSRLWERGRTGRNVVIAVLGLFVLGWFSLWTAWMLLMSTATLRQSRP